MFSKYKWVQYNPFYHRYNIDYFWWHQDVTHNDMYLIMELFFWILIDGEERVYIMKIMSVICKQMNATCKP